jgi:hypothetical protein
MDVWGFCGNCRRWFYVAGSAGGAAESCPVCWVPAVTLRDRSVDRPDQACRLATTRSRTLVAR